MTDTEEQSARILAAIDQEIAVHQRVAEVATDVLTYRRAEGIINGMERAKVIIGQTR